MDQLTFYKAKSERLSNAIALIADELYALPMGEQKHEVKVAYHLASLTLIREGELMRKEVREGILSEAKNDSGLRD